MELWEFRLGMKNHHCGDEVGEGTLQKSLCRILDGRHSSGESRVFVCWLWGGDGGTMALPGSKEAL